MPQNECFVAKSAPIQPKTGNNSTKIVKFGTFTTLAILRRSVVSIPVVLVHVVAASCGRYPGYIVRAKNTFIDVTIAVLLSYGGCGGPADGLVGVSCR